MVVLITAAIVLPPAAVAVSAVAAGVLIVVEVLIKYLIEVLTDICSSNQTQYSQAQQNHNLLLQFCNYANNINESNNPTEAEIHRSRAQRENIKELNVLNIEYDV